MPAIEIPSMNCMAVAMAIVFQGTAFRFSLKIQQMPIMKRIPKTPENWLMASSLEATC
jgi:hypothetical protein